MLIHVHCSILIFYFYTIFFTLMHPFGINHAIWINHYYETYVPVYSIQIYAVLLPTVTLWNTSIFYFIMIWIIIFTWITFPMTTELTSSGLTLPASRAAFEACTIRSVGEVLTNLPPNVPKAVLLAATMKTSDTAVTNMRFNHQLNWSTYNGFSNDVFSIFKCFDMKFMKKVSIEKFWTIYLQWI